MNLKPNYYGIWKCLPGGPTILWAGPYYSMAYPIIVQCFYVDDIGPGVRANENERVVPFCVIPNHIIPLFVFPEI